MPAADELYLLSQKSSDLCFELNNQFQRYFDWLDEVVLSAKESRGETIIPKTPARKKKNKKVVEDIENVPPTLPPPLPPPAENIRKSSRAAAKAAQEKTKKTIQQISNIGTKIRRPSTPPQIKPEVSRIILDIENELVENTADIFKPNDIIELPETPNSKIDDRLEDRNNFEAIDEKRCSTESNDDLDIKVLPLNDNPPVKEKLAERTHQEVIDKVPSQEEVDNHEFTKPTRITRTKKRIAEATDISTSVQPEEILVRSTRSKRRKLEEEENKKEIILESRENILKNKLFNSNQPTCNGTLSDSQRNLHIPHTLVENGTSVTQSSENMPLRVTRSKIRNLSPKKSPQKIIDYCSPKQFTPNKTSSNKAHLTPKAKVESPIFIKSSDSPQNRFKMNKLNNLKISKTTRVENISIESNEMCSSPLVVKHTLKSGTSTLPRNKNSRQTPSPISSSTAKMLGIKQSIFGSAGFQSTYAQKRKPIICSSPQIGGKAIGTPTEVSRVKNIVMGPSFLTKVLPNKPTKEETEEKKKEEMMRKREREEEIRRKREEILKFQREEKKRKNEERMRKVQESRELKEKREVEAREMQEKERKQREERLKEEKRRKQMEFRKNEEMKLRKQAEEERQREEKRLREEQQRILEEQKIREELRVLEERRKIESKKLQEKMEVERIAREKLELERIREEQRIAREKEEMERIKIKETLRIQSEKLNETYTTNIEHPLNTTYSKPGLNSTFQKSSEVQNSEVVTPMPEKKRPKSRNAEDYGIADLRSDDSTDDECKPKKNIPSWAGGSNLKKTLLEQEFYPPDLDALFPPFVLLQMPDLTKIFTKRRSRYCKRTSSAVWNTPPYKVLAQNR